MASNQSTSSAAPESLPRSTSKGAADLSEIVVFTDNRREGSGILEFAAQLAEENGARLISIFVRPSPGDTPQQGFARGAGIGKVIEKHQSQLEGIEGRHQTRFEDVVRRHGIRDPKWKSLSQWNNEVAIQAYSADLVVISRPEHGGQGSDPPGLAESLVLSSGRPVILFPPGGTASLVRRILIGWSATREAIRAVADAVPLLTRAKAVEVLIVDYERKRERHGQQPGAEVVRRLADLGVQVELQPLSSKGQDVGHLLLSQAAAFRADLLVMGAYGQSKLRESIFGGVTRTVLYEASLPVLMSR